MNVWIVPKQNSWRRAHSRSDRETVPIVSAAAVNILMVLIHFWSNLWSLRHIPYVQMRFVIGCCRVESGCSEFMPIVEG